MGYPKTLKKLTTCAVIFYTLNKTLPDERHLKGRIDNGMISLKHLSTRDGMTYDRHTYSLEAITYYPFGASSSAFAVCSVAELNIGGKRIKLFGILNTWLKIT